ncbi:sporulation protein YpjB [Paenibacillus soyae]|uniref:Sporulation protein YpjB n=1 Tax=Paenibacillus soyae TaxID=2969249 RepID=A0A9X2S903_9BACL|nr:sporulation protein YpjB [Paenibacillus soyae]MCR2802988.1 sporulation protein YpjB [Paenibacillus soyae]
MKARFIIPLIVFIGMAAGSAGVVWGSASPGGSYDFLFADSPYRQLYKLDESATALYTAAYANNRHAAYAELQRLKRLMEDAMIQSYGTPEGWSAQLGDAAALERELSAGVPDSSWIEHAVRLRLGADALVGGEGALWLQYEGLLKEDLQAVRQAWKRSTGDAAIAAGAMLKGMTTHAHRIESAALYAGDSTRMNELLKRISYSERLLEAAANDRSKIKPDQIEQSFDGIQSAISGVFLHYEEALAIPAEKSSALGHPLQWSLFLGTLISAVLTWSGWRKYKQSPFGVKKL